jgi:hypothetical protein
MSEQRQRQGTFSAHINALFFCLARRQHVQNSTTVFQRRMSSPWWKKGRDQKNRKEIQEPDGNERLRLPIDDRDDNNQDRGND